MTVLGGINLLLRISRLFPLRVFGQSGGDGLSGSLICCVRPPILLACCDLYFFYTPILADDDDDDEDDAADAIGATL